jgi:hypothetical protein
MMGNITPHGEQAMIIGPDFSPYLPLASQVHDLEWYMVLGLVPLCFAQWNDFTVGLSLERLTSGLVKIPVVLKKGEDL